MRQVQLREAEASLSELVQDASRGEAAIITRDGKPQAVIIGIEEWNRLRDIPSFAQLLTSIPVDRDDLPTRDTTPLRDPEL